MVINPGEKKEQAAPAPQTEGAQPAPQDAKKHCLPRRNFTKGVFLQPAPTVYYLPRGFEPIVFNGMTYYYNEGIFYQQVGEQLVAVGAPVGAIVPSISTNHETIHVSDGVYDLYKGVYYKMVMSGYKVVLPPPEVSSEINPSSAVGRESVTN